MKTFALSAICGLWGLFAAAQSGTEFWFAPPEVTSGHVTDNPIVLRIATAANPATVTIEQPANAALFNGSRGAVEFTLAYRPKKGL